MITESIKPVVIGYVLRGKDGTYHYDFMSVTNNKFVARVFTKEQMLSSTVGDESKWVPVYKHLHEKAYEDFLLKLKE